MDEDKNSLDVMLDTCQVVSFSKYLELPDKTNTFFTRRGYNSNTMKFTEEVNWDEVFTSNADAYLQSIEPILMGKKSKRITRPIGSNHLLDEKPDLTTKNVSSTKQLQGIAFKVGKKSAKEVSTDIISNKPDLSMDTPSTKKRGRRKKEDITNEPPINTLVNAVPDLSANPPSSGKRGRGRPRKVQVTNMLEDPKHITDEHHDLIEERPNLSIQSPTRERRIRDTQIPIKLDLKEDHLANEVPSKSQKTTREALELPIIEDEKISDESDKDPEFDETEDKSIDIEEPEDSDFEEESKKPVPTTPRKRRKVTQPVTPTAKTPKTSPRKSRSPIKDLLRTPTRKIVVKPPRSASSLPIRPSADYDERPASPHQIARGLLHVSTVPDSLPCRENEFSQLFLALESAINAETGSCIYVSGTPGTGKTATVREVISQLQLRCEEGELSDFSFIEINGMKLINPQEAYEIMWEEISGQRVSASNAVTLLEKEFKQANPQRVPTLVLMDEMDQLVTKSQAVMYNFFNWPTFRNSKLIVVAVANTMDLPERMLSNKISSRLGLTRIQFPGYNHEQLREIIESRLLAVQDAIVEKDAIEFASRKVASVSGDARRALDICRRAVELAELDSLSAKDHKELVKINHIKRAIDETTRSPLFLYLQSLPLACKIFLSAVLARVRRSGVIENSLGDILEEAKRLCKLSQKADKLLDVFYGEGQIRMNGFLKAVTELIEGGVLVQQSMRGERSARIRLTVAEEEVKTAFKNDKEIDGMV